MEGLVFIQLSFGTGRGNRTPFIGVTIRGKDHIYEPDITCFYFFDEGEGKQHLFQILSIPYSQVRNKEPLVLLVWIEQTTYSLLEVDFSQPKLLLYQLS